MDVNKVVNNNNIFIIHFSPIEDYPPAMNLLKIIAVSSEKFKIKIFTTKSLKSKPYQINNIEIKRRKNPSNLNRMLRFFFYLYFHFTVFFELLSSKPSRIFYYETLSSLAPIIYCWLKGWRVDLHIHYHEYATPEEYRNGMLTGRFFHYLERKIYKKAKWISLTNEHIVNKFILNNSIVNKGTVQSLPNFPPKDWAARTLNKIKIEKPIKFVFVGSLSNETMFYKEIAEWLLALDGKASLDIFSQQISEEVVEHINLLGNNILHNKGIINYYDLPKVLPNYDVGLILYRGHIPNFVYNATNKLFEYLACGLDVWFPEEMLGVYDYITQGTYPKVIKIDFKNLNKYDLYELISHDGLNYKPSTYFAEDVYEPFIKNYLLK